VESAAAAWIARRERDDWTQQDQDALEAWIASGTDHRVAWLRLSATWEKTHRLKTLRADAAPGNVPRPEELRSPFFGQQDAEASSDCRAENRAERGSRGLTMPRRWAVAAAILLIVAGATTWKLFPTSPAYETDIGAVEAVPLADGSRVTLNTDTRIKVDLGQSERRVNLARGEAYFEVAKDPTRPFVVSVDDKRIVAVGTSFSVRRDADGVRVFVTEGTVRVDQGEAGHTAHSFAQLQSGTIAHAVADDVIIQTRPVAEVEQMLTWRTGYLVFDDTPMSEAIAEFNRYNRRKIFIADPQIATIRIGGNFRATNVEAFLRLVESDFPVVATEQDQQITLTTAPSEGN
jgi:transmembrane sensor